MSYAIAKKPIFIDPKTLPEEFPKNQDFIPLISKKGLLGDHQVTIWHDPTKGLVANVLELSSSSNRGQLKAVPITGFPVEIGNRGVYDQFIKVLESSYWIPKMFNNELRELEIRPALKGGMHAKIPFQDGLALGSIVRGSIITKMDAYSKQISELDALEEQCSSVEKRIEALSIDTSRASQLESKRLEVYKGALEKKITEKENESPSEIPVFSSFQIGIRSPIDTQASQVVVQPRGFDSLKYSSKYLSLMESEAKIADKINQSASSGSVSAKGGWGFFSASLSTSWAKSATDRVNTIKKSNRASGVLLVNASLTSRNVRCYSSLKYDLGALKSLEDIIKKAPSEKKEEYLDRSGISLENGEPVVYILTEAPLGGSFTALVTFLNEEELNRRAEMHASERTRTSEVSLGYLGVGNAKGAYSSSNARQSEEDALRQLMSTRVEIEFISQGAIPGFARDVVEREVMQHLSLNPAQFSLSQGNREEAKALVSAKGKELATLQMQRQLRMEEAQSGVVNACRELASAKSSQRIHTPESVMEAYENFARQMTTDRDSGVPIGFNYTRLTFADIQREIQGLEKGSGNSIASTGND